MRVLETERMRLRPFSHDDVDDLLGIFQDPEAMRYYPGVKDREEAFGVFIFPVNRHIG